MTVSMIVGALLALEADDVFRGRAGQGRAQEPALPRPARRRDGPAHRGRVFVVRLDETWPSASELATAVHV